ncbi:MAG: 3-isopropylmalate dehydratase small subunit 2 [Candidatus Binatia bacterium]
MSQLIKIARVSGRPIPLRGNDIDTDRIIPGRFLKGLTFEGLGDGCFYDERFDAQGRSKGHAMDDPRYRADGSRIAVVNQNFGCGSSREHAPRALLRCGIKALVGESFADIFMGNCIAIGVPCATASEGDIAALMAAIERDPAQELTLDIDAQTARYGGHTIAVKFPGAARNQFLAGTWDATRVLLEATPQIKAVAARLPYVTSFAS